MNKKISQFDIASSINNLDLIPIVQDGKNKTVTKVTLEKELSNTFVADSEFEEKVDNLVTDLTVLEKKHDDAIQEVNGIVKDWSSEISNKPSYDQLQELLNRIIVCENQISNLAKEIANGGGNTGGGSSSDIVGPHSQSTATIFPLTGYIKDANADPLDSSDTLNEALSKLENQIEAIAGNGEGGLNMPLIKTNETTNATGNDGALFTAGAVEERFLNANGDIAKGKLTLMQGFQAGNEFRSGWDGEGVSLYSIDKNKWNLELDNLFVRGNMTVNELTVNEIKAVGGDILVTIADIECVNVVDSSEGWLCYFKDEDGSTFSGFKALDQAICQKFDGKNVKRYWRTVLSVNEEDNYIVLAKSDTQCEPFSGIPEVGDKILQLGHRADTSLTPEELAERRNAIFISAKGENSPRITFYKNIDDFTLVGKDTTVIGSESKFVGTFTQVSSNGDYVRVPTYRGKWVATATYNYYDQVTHNGSLWICMEDDVIASEPSVNNIKWQLQVQKGEPGISGDDTAKFIEITGDRLFLYDTTDYSGTPTPEKIILYVTSHGISEEATYKWTLQGDSYVELGTGTTLEVNPDMFTGKSATIRCTAYEGEASVPYYDDFQIAKLSNGENTYYIDLSNSNVSVPYDYEYTTPLLPLSTFYTEVYTYYGTKPVEVSSIDTITVSGTATAVVDGNIVRLHSLNSGSAKIRINVTLSNGEIIHKDWFITRIRSGKDGGSGADAAYVMVAGEQIFKSLQGSTTEFVPSSITLSTMAYNIIEPTYKWYWSFPGSGEWNIIENATSSEYELYPTTSYFANVNEISIKCEAVAKNGGNTYYDVISINKISDGIDGTGTYHGVLTNEMHTVASTYLGEVTDEELNRAKTSIKLYYQTELLKNSSFTWTATSISEYDDKYWEEDYENYTLKLISMPTDTVVLRVHFLVNSKEVDACDFTVTKAKAGVPGDYEVSVYATVDSSITSVIAPAFTEIPSSNGSLSGGNIWYTDPKPTGNSLVWRSVGLFDGETNKLKSGKSWSTPVIFQGVNGSTGPQGPSGPALNFRGAYESGATYYRTQNRVDVVKWNNTYYMVYPGRNGFSGISPKYNSVADGNTSSTAYWISLSSFEMLATGVLFAEDATIGGWHINERFLYSNTKTVYLSATGAVAMAISNENNPAVITDDSGNLIANEDADIKLYGSLPLITIGRKAGIYGYTSEVNDSMSSEEKDHIDDDIIRIWAGGDMNAAPFRVYDNGKIIAREADITGNVTCKTLNVTDYANWGGPGVKAIFHIGHSSGTSETSQNSGELIYSVNNVKVSIHSRPQTGHTKFNLSGINGSYSVLVNGMAYGTASVGMRATYGVYNISNASFTILSVDTDNNNHNLHDVDIIILGY